MCLNADKCAFGVGASKFLGYLITNRGIVVNLNQIEAVQRLKPPGNLKEVQVLTEMLATLNLFISKFVNRCHPFYQILKKWKGFKWNEECERAFQDLKEYLMQAPMLTAPEPREDLRDQGVQQLVYYISKTLVDAETRYLPLEKLVLALVHSTRKLPHYFQAYTIYVLIEYPLQLLLKRSDFTGQIAKWETQLGSFNIRYKPRSSVKGQVLANFVVEFSLKNEGEMVCHVECCLWKVFVDSASSTIGAGTGIVIITPEGIRSKHSLRLGFRAFNNKVEYKALLVGLKTILGMRA